MHKLQIPNRLRVNRNKGQSLAEYALVLALVCVVAMGSLGMLGDSLKSQFLGLSSTIAQVSGSGSASAAGASTGLPTTNVAISGLPTGGTPATGTTAQQGCNGAGCFSGGAHHW